MDLEQQSINCNSQAMYVRQVVVMENIKQFIDLVFTKCISFNFNIPHLLLLVLDIAHQVLNIIKLTFFSSILLNHIPF